jgi:hypothetical protein
MNQCITKEDIKYVGLYGVCWIHMTKHIDLLSAGNDVLFKKVSVIS